MCPVDRERQNWTCSLARNMATNEELRAEVNELKAEVNELKAEVNGLRTQMSEMVRVLIPLGYTLPSNPKANQGAGPVAIIENVQPASIGSEGMIGEPRAQIPHPTVIPQATLQSFTPQLAAIPQAQDFTTGNPAYPQIHHSTPTMAPTLQLPHNVSSFPQVYSAEHQQTKDQFQILEERLRRVEGFGSRAREARDLCLIPDVVLPPKFKVPDFDKYRGATCPKSHLTMYCRKMSTYSHDDRLLIHCFQESLAGASLNWYMKLEPSQVRCWKDLADAFLKQYQYNTDMAPDRTQLQGMSKRDNESFKEYAQRWRALAAQCTPPLLDKELVSMFLETLPPLYYDRLISSASSNFSDVVIVGERIENGLRSGKIAQSSPGNTSVHKNPSSGFPAKKNEEANPITGQKKSPRYDPIPMSYTNLCRCLISHNLISPREMKPVQPPFPKGYNPQATCEFHAGAIGHSAENCYLLKHLVQGLIDSRRLTFEEGGEGFNPLSSELSGQNGNS